MLDPSVGLSSEEARRRLVAYGRNELPRGRRRGIHRLILDALRDPVVALLVIATVIYAFLGQPKDAVLLLGSVVVIIAIEIYQGGAAERALEALRSISAGEAHAVRNGRLVRIPVAEVVPGDCVLLAEGEKVPADGAVLSASDLLVDESLLTGESVPVRKSVGSPQAPWRGPGGDDLPFVYAQTAAVRGHAYVEVRATGTRTEVSKIAHLLETIDVEVGTLVRQTRTLVLSMAFLALVLCTAVAVLVGWREGAWISGILAGVALAIALLPEEIPVVLSVFTAFGARRLATRNVLTRRLGSIPTLGALTVLCVDKTGTLTLNRMTVSTILGDREGRVLPLDPFSMDSTTRAVLDAALHSSDPDAVDPMERAIADRASEWGIAPLRRADPDLVKRYPLRPGRPTLIHAWKVGGAERARVRVCIKGAPEAVIAQSASAPADRERWMGRAAQMAASGLRVLGVGESEIPADGVPEEPDRLSFRFLGLVGLSDPLRPGVVQAITECRDAGVRVIMLTGDHPETARAIAREAGLDSADRVLTGAELNALAPAERATALRTVNVFSRISPAEKLEIVTSLKEAGEVVGVTGDGVNDAPALRAANVGVAMGLRGTEVAREASSLVLLDDAFPTLVVAVRTGRRIYDNIRKSVSYLLAIHFIIAGMALLPVLFGFPILLYPVEIVFIEFVVDPTSTLAFEAEAEEIDVMRRPPRDPSAPVANRSIILLSLAQGFGILVATAGLYFALVDSGFGESLSRTLAFSCLVAANLTLVLATRSAELPIWRSIFRPNRILWLVILSGVGLLLAALYLPPLPQVFGFESPPGLELLGAVGLGALAACAMEPFKRWTSRVEAGTLDGRRHGADPSPRP